MMSSTTFVILFSFCHQPLLYDRDHYLIELVFGNDGMLIQAGFYGRRRKHPDPHVTHLVVFQRRQHERHDTAVHTGVFKFVEELTLKRGYFQIELMSRICQSMM